MALGYTLFDTALGPCALAWSDAGLVAVQLPHPDARETERLLLSRVEAHEASPPGWVAAAMRRLARRLEGADDDLADVPVDLSALAGFQRQVLELARRIPAGQTKSYGALAAEAGKPGAARAVGRAMATNPVPLVVPCHRVLAANGEPGGFTAPGGLTTKEKLLALEGVSLKPQRALLEVRHEGLCFHPDEATRHLCARDERLAALIARVPFHMRPEKMQSPFHALARAIVYQQLTGKAAKTILGRVVALFPGRKFPTPEDMLAVDFERLRAAGLSNNKALALKDLAAKVLDGTVPTLKRLERMGDDEIVERLTAVRGIGRWTVEMMLIFRLGRPDVLPVADLGVQKGFAKTYGKRKLPTREQLAKAGERWRPYRSVASWYMWRALEL